MIRKLLETTLALAALAALPAVQAAVFQYDAILDGPSESPANASPGTGYGTFTYDDVAHTLAINFSFSGLLGTVTASHIHAPTVNPGVLTAGVATTTPTFAGTPTGVTAGAYSNTLDLTLSSSFNPAFVTANGGTPASAEIALINAINAGKAYLNIHTSVFGGGEIRGFLGPVPEPSTLALASLGVLALRRRRK